MTITLEDEVCGKFISAYKTAPLLFQTKITHQICQEKIKHWARDLPKLVKMMKKQDVESAILTDWEKYYPKEIVAIAREIAFDIN